MKIFNILIILFFIGITSCTTIKKNLTSLTTTVKKYPKDKPFVYKSSIILKNVRKVDEERIGKDLSNYLDDSLKVIPVKRFIFWKVIKNPPVFDSINIHKSVQFVQSYLHSIGYFNAKDTFMVESERKGDQQRRTIFIEVEPRKSFKIDSVAFDIKDSTLQRSIQADVSNTLLQIGTPYSKNLIAAELDRIIQHERNNGYYNMSKDVLMAQIDTTDVSLLQSDLDPFEQLKKIAEATKKQQENPSIHVTIQQRKNVDSLKLKHYINGSIYFYPETALSDQPEALLEKRLKYTMINKGIYVFDKTGLFNKNIFSRYCFVRPSRLYKDATFNRTINTYNQIGTWQQVDFRTIPYIDSIRLKTNPDSAFRVDYHFFMTPAKKQSFSIDLEGSRNTGDIVSVGNLLGISTSLSLLNRNVWKQAIQSNTSLRAGIELNFGPDQQTLQTVQFSAGHSYSFPRFILPFTIPKEYRFDYSRSLLNFSITYTDRRNFYRLQNILMGWGYEWKYKNRTWVYRPLNIELYNVERLQGLQEAINDNPFLQYAFNNGNVVSQLLSVTQTFSKGRRSSSIHLNIEESGSLVGLIKSLQGKVFRYVKIDAEYKWLLQKKYSAWAFRAFAGSGFNYSNDPNIGRTLPFFKQYIAGGPNSMRAWPMRQLGLGSSIQNDTATRFKDRFGDVQIETNLEYRFKIMTLFGIDLGGACFVDAGNIWNLSKDPNNTNSEFRFKNIYKDLAIGTGFGLRLDFNYFLIRGDIGFRLKDPARQTNNGWIEKLEMNSIDATGRKRSNTAFQLGIGLPF